MIYISRLLHQGRLTERQVHAAHRFRRDPEAWRGSLPPTAWRLLHEIVVEDAKITRVEEREGWSVLSGKIVLGVLLTMMEETPAPASAAKSAREETIEDLRDRLDFVIGEDDEAIHIMQELNVPRTAARLFLILKRANNRALTRETVWRRLYAEKSEADWPDDRIIDVLVCKLRPALAEHGRYEILTVYGAGFCLVDRAGATVKHVRTAS